MTATTENGFTSVAQSGSGVVWTGLSNMVYPTEGAGACELTGTSQTANTVQLRIPQEAADIPTGATFTSMALYIQVKKTGSFSSATNVTWSGLTSYSTSTVWTFTQTTDESYQNLALSGDKSYWSISSAWSTTAIIDALKSGALYFKVNAQTTSAIACGIRLNAATCVINYESTVGRSAALITTLV